MQTSTTLEELAEVLAIYFQQLVKHTNVCLTQYFNDGENYKHYFSTYPMIYMFYFIDELCNKYSMEEYNYRYSILMNIFTKSFALSEEEAKEAVFAVSNLGMDATKRTVEEGWELGQIIFRLAKRDVDAFSFDEMTKQQIDNYNLILLLDNKSST